jgi:hypothetical protein
MKVASASIRQWKPPPKHFLYETRIRIAIRRGEIYLDVQHGTLACRPTRPVPGFNRSLAAIRRIDFQAAIRSPGLPSTPGELA